ncbi:NAD(P)/FAD-dependent oxidoreductase [Treponema zuelzerae]|uniref:NAD(P)/FAD-dependent oxidoreductase n=1 Tax=Teretinema zuelzerae TaxID=156 RepID=A0AAE3EET9_9SPIR|nr:NAD(P)/FAD-dependent oxidoreductase [Teretinema zuelzerae]MCD1653330.1 NAD(P)/FAD-dependent oxidoreductase [Teretinema zuelzerae]
MMYDSIIIGKGPAGISASLYLVRAGLKVLVLGHGVGALERAEKIDNYYGFDQPLSGAELAARGVAQARRIGAEIREEEAVNISMEDAWVVKTAGGEYRGRSVLLATGKSRAGLKVPGFEELRGKGISFCATCDGFFYKNKRLAVIGTGDYAANELSELAHFTKDITLFTNGAEPASARFPEGLAVEKRMIDGFAGSDKLTGISLEGGEAMAVDGAFVALGTAGAADFAAKIGVELNKTDIVVDQSFMTNVPGIFAAGDCIGGYLQIAKAVSDGAHAAKHMVPYIKSLQ